MKTIAINLYSFTELSKEIQEKVLNAHSDINVMFEWWDTVYDDAKTVGLQIDVFDLDQNKHCSGSIIGTYEETAMLIKENHGTESKIYKLADKFLSKFYEFENMDIECAISDDVADLEYNFLRDLLKEYANMLQKEYDYLTSYEQIKETIEGNEYTFEANGKMRDINEEQIAETDKLITNLKDKLCQEQLNLKAITWQTAYNAPSEFYRIWSKEVPARIDNLTWVVNELLKDVLDEQFKVYYNDLLNKIKF